MVLFYLTYITLYLSLVLQKSAAVPVPGPEPSAEGSSDAVDGASPQYVPHYFCISGLTRVLIGVLLLNIIPVACIMIPSVCCIIVVVLNL